MMGIIGMIVAALVFLGDCLIKDRIEKNLRLGEVREKCGGRILIRRTHNRGAMLNFGEKRSGLITALAFSVTVLATIVFCISLGRKGDHLLQFGLALLLGGAYSNLYDRLKRKYVVDYFSFGVKWKKLRRIVFNISDFCIMIGAVLVALGAQER